MRRPMLHLLRGRPRRQLWKQFWHNELTFSLQRTRYLWTLQHPSGLPKRRPLQVDGGRRYCNANVVRPEGLEFGLLPGFISLHIIQDRGLKICDFETGARSVKFPIGCRCSTRVGRPVFPLPLPWMILAQINRRSPLVSILITLFPVSFLDYMPLSYSFFCFCMLRTPHFPS